MRFRLAMNAFGWALSSLRRGEGLLLGRSGGRPLVLAPCRDVHTFGMRWPMDVAFIAEDGTVLRTCREVGPWRRLKENDAWAVVERISSHEPWLEEGDVISLEIRRGRHAKGGRDEGVSRM